MKVQAEVSLYPLRTPHLAEPIEQFVGQLRQEGLDLQLGPISTHITGNSDLLFATLSKAFKEIAKDYNVVLLLTVSNACPGT